ncbi:MAG: pirin family protein [Deltaproteobacteria bacterium]|nr:pirin family protein [Nannocystaceae bacterium]
MSIPRRKLLLGALAVAPAIIGCEIKSGSWGARPAKDGRSKITGRIVARATTDGDGATLSRLFPAKQLANLDPFVLLDDFDVREPAGFPQHPHRGFEAFTYMIDGEFHHADDLGNESSISTGGTQRFTSGRGARHSEMPGAGPSNRGLQLWVNLEASRKQMAPEYEGIAGADMPVREQDGLRVRTIVGPDSPVRLHTELDYLDVELLAARGWEREVTVGHNALVYVLDGELELLGEQVARGSAVLLAPGAVTLRGGAGARFAWLTGRPHGQPIRHRGPFVD